METYHITLVEGFVCQSECPEEIFQKDYNGTTPTLADLKDFIQELETRGIGLTLESSIYIGQDE